LLAHIRSFDEVLFQIQCVLINLTRSQIPKACRNWLVRKFRTVSGERVLDRILDSRLHSRGQLYLHKEGVVEGVGRRVNELFHPSQIVLGPDLEQPLSLVLVADKGIVATPRTIVYTIERGEGELGQVVPTVVVDSRLGKHLVNDVGEVLGFGNFERWNLVFLDSSAALEPGLHEFLVAHVSQHQCLSGSCDGRTRIVGPKPKIIERGINQHCAVEVLLHTENKGFTLFPVLQLAARLFIGHEEVRHQMGVRLRHTLVFDVQVLEALGLRRDEPVFRDKPAEYDVLAEAFTNVASLGADLQDRGE